MSFVPGIEKNCGKTLLSSSLESHAGLPDITLTIFSQCLPGNKSLSLCIPFCIPFANIPMHKAVLPGQVSGAATLDQDVTPRGLLPVSHRNTPFPRKELHGH